MPREGCHLGQMGQLCAAEAHSEQLGPGDCLLAGAQGVLVVPLPVYRNKYLKYLMVTRYGKKKAG